MCGLLIHFPASSLSAHIFLNVNPRLWYLVEWMWSALRKVASPLFAPQGNSFFHGVKFSVQTFSPGSIPNLICDEVILDWRSAPDGPKAHLGLMDWVESMKLSEAQNCPANALVNLVHDLSTSWTFGENTAETLAPTAEGFGGSRQFRARHTPLDSDNSSSSSSCSSTNSPIRLEKQSVILERTFVCRLLCYCKITVAWDQSGV